MGPTPKHMLFGKLLLTRDILCWQSNNVAKHNKKPKKKKMNNFFPLSPYVLLKKRK